MSPNDLSTATTTISEAQQAANQANAKKSTGPRTPEGKARAKMNALRHGLTGQFYVLSEDDRLAYNHFESNILEALAPVGHYERDLAIAIAQNRWRLHRARAIESNIHGIGQTEYADTFDADTPETEVAVAQSQTWLNHHHAITNLTLYENRIRRDVARDKKELDELQTTRKAAEAKAREEAELLLATHDPGQATIEVNGFEFSIASLRAGLNRKATLAAARAHQSNPPAPAKHPVHRPKAA